MPSTGVGESRSCSVGKVSGEKRRGDESSVIEEWKGGR